MKYSNNTGGLENVAQKFDGFSYSTIRGYWKGQAEKTAVVEISTRKAKAVKDLATQLREALEQDAVMVQRVTGSVQFV